MLLNFFQHHDEDHNVWRGQPSTSHSPEVPPGHFVMNIPATNKKRFPRRRCKQCSKKTDVNGKPVRKETRYLCKLCQVPLCLLPCFEEYHTK